MTKIVGILNTTPDSFSDGGVWNNPDAAVARVEQLFDEGANIVDIGAESTRPGADEVAIEEEWQRLEPVIQKLQDSYRPENFSFDTRHGEIAKRIVGAWSPEVIINDVTGLSEPRMVEVVALHGLQVIASHLPAVASGNISRAHQEKMTGVHDVKRELTERAALLIHAGIAQKNIILDPGIGFGKSPELNNRLVEFAPLVPQFPVMIGYSRKRFVGKELHANLELGRKAIASGAAYLRVHDVSAHRALLNKSHS